MSSLKQAIIASLTEHPDAEKYRKRAFVENPAQLVEALAGKQVLTKADFLSPDDEGKPFIDSAGAWRNFDKIAEIVRLGGEKFTYDDFTTAMAVGAEKTLLDSAKGYGGTMKIFTPEVWQGQYDDMEKLWYKLPGYERNRTQGLVPIDLKRKVLAFEGRTAPEDGLAKVRMSLSDIRGAVMSDYNFKDITDRLGRAGDYLRKEYILMKDSVGDTVFDTRPASWGKYEAVLKILQAHGERLEVSDYTRQLSTTPSLLGRAAENKALNRIFAPEQWVDRLPDMLSLWSHVLDAWKGPPMTTQDFDNAYAIAEDKTYARRFLERPLSGKTDLLAPLNPGRSEKPVLPLGLKILWDNFDAAKTKLDEKGEALTTADLRTPSGQMGDSCLIAAAKFGRFDKVVEIARASGQPLTMDDFLSKDGHGNTLISILAEKRQLSQVFTVDAWTGHISDMRKLWAHVAATHRKQINYTQLETGVKQATLKEKAKDGYKINPR